MFARAAAFAACAIALLATAAAQPALPSVPSMPSIPSLPSPSIASLPSASVPALPGLPLSSLPSLPGVSIADGARVIVLHVPLSASASSSGPRSGSLQEPLGSGVLDVVVSKAALPGAGGSADVGAYLVQAQAVLPTGALPLPTMVVESAPDGVPPEAQSQVDAVAAAAADLQSQLAALAAMAQSQVPDSQPIVDQAGALAAQAAWIQALAEAAASQGSAGAAAEAALAQAMLARVAAGLELLQQGLDGFSHMMGLDATPSPSSEAPSPSPSPSDSSMSLPPIPDDIVAALAAAQQQAADLAAQVAAAQGAVADAVGQALDQATAGLADAQAKAQAALDGARIAAQDAQDMLMGKEGDAQSAAEGQAASVAAAIDDLQRQAGEQAAPAAEAVGQAMSAIDDALAQLQWARDWSAAAQGYAAGSAAGSAADAQAALDQALSSTMAVATLVSDAASAHGGAAAADALAQAQALVRQADAQARDAEAKLSAAMASLGVIPAGLAPAVSSDAANPAQLVAVCMMLGDGQVCADYATPSSPDQGAVTVLVAVPTALDPQGLLSSVSEATGMVPSPPSIGPLPLPGGSSSSSSSPASSTSSSPASDSGSSSLPVDALSSSSSSSSSSAAASGAGSAGGQSPQPPVLDVHAAPDPLALDSGQQGILTVTVRNSGGSADSVRITLQGDAPVAWDMDQDTVSVPAGASVDVPVRITPQAAGSGHLTAIATGAVAQPASDDVAVSVAAPAASAASISASLDPTSLQGVVGHASLLTVRLANAGAAADVVKVAADAAGVDVEPAGLQVALQPGESAVRQLTLTPLRDGSSVVHVRLTSAHGLDLAPLASIAAMEPAAAEPPSDAHSSSPAPDAGHKSPGLGMLLTAAAVLGVAFAVRRRLR